MALFIGTIASACYVATWEALFFGFIPDFGEQYAVISIMAERMPPRDQPERPHDFLHDQRSLREGFQRRT